jgi:multidrug resistance efflux pump
LQGYIGAAGLVEPNGEEVAIGAHRSGVIESVKVTAGDTVKAGETLFVLDQRAAKGAVDLRRAELLAAERRRDQTVARTASLKAQVEAARAAANAAQAEMEEWADQLKSGEELLAKGGNAISQREVTRRRNTERSAQARLEEARARIVQLEEELKLIAAPNGATLAVDEAAVEQARRMLETAEIDLGLLDVRAPINATVLQVNVRPGEFAFAGTVVTPLIILGNLDPLHVRVDIDEGDVSRFSPAATAYASLRGQPNERMQLKFVRVEPIIVPKRSLTGAAGERVDTRVLRVIYALPSDSGQAFSGQQVDVFIESVGRRAHVSQSAP